jgi:hypothetical protein
VPNSIDLIEGLDEVLFLEDVKDDLYATGMIGDVEVTLLLLAVWLTEGDEGVGDAHTLFVARGEYLVGGELDEGKLQRRATAV